MTMIKRFILLFSVILLASCSNDDDAGQPVVEELTTYETIAQSPDHSILTQALRDTGLKQILDTGVFTVFAPTDAAFASIDADDLSGEELTNLLLNHLLDGAASSTDLEVGYLESKAKDSNGNAINMYVGLDGGVLLNGMSSVIAEDLTASNGVVHVVDEVITIPTVVTFATADPDFSSLAAALTRESSFTYVETLSSTDSPAPFTVFAPTNAAFSNLLSELGLNALADIPTATLEATLNTHVIAGDNIRSTDLANGTVGTLGDDIVIDADEATITDPNGRVSSIIAVDVQAGNGVIHAIDTVLLPMQ